MNHRQAPIAGCTRGPEEVCSSSSPCWGDRQVCQCLHLPAADTPTMAVFKFMHPEKFSEIQWKSCFTRSSHSAANYHASLWVPAGFHDYSNLPWCVPNFTFSLRKPRKNFHSSLKIEAEYYRPWFINYSLCSGCLCQHAHWVRVPGQLAGPLVPPRPRHPSDAS